MFRSKALVCELQQQTGLPHTGVPDLSKQPTSPLPAEKTERTPWVLGDRFLGESHKLIGNKCNRFRCYYRVSTTSGTPPLPSQGSMMYLSVRTRQHENVTYS